MKSNLGSIALAWLTVSGISLGTYNVAAAADEHAMRVNAVERENAELRKELSTLRERDKLRAEVARLRARSSQQGPSSVGVPSGHDGPLSDYASALPMKAPAPAPLAYNWTGVYIGGHFGAGWAQTKWTSPVVDCGLAPIPCLNDFGTASAIGPLGGGQIGFNWQAGHWVLGVEAQYSAAELKGDRSSSLPFAFTQGTTAVVALQSGEFHTKVSGLGTIAGRLGLASDRLDRTLFYVKGGAAFAQTTFTAQQSYAVSVCDNIACMAATATSSSSGNNTRWGWMAGAGLEYGLFDNWSARVEYDFLSFGTKTITQQGITCVVNTPPGTCLPFNGQYNIAENIHLIKFGINYRFGDGRFGQ